MQVASALVLMTTEPVSGRSRIGSLQADPVIGGAFLHDLIAQGRVELAGEGRRARVDVRDPATVADPVLQRAFLRLQGRRPLKPRAAVTRLGKGGKDRVYAALCAEGVLRRREEKALGIFPVKRYDLIAADRRDQLVDAVRRVLLNDQETDVVTGPLIGLLLAADLVKVVVDKPDRKLAKRRAEVLAEGDWVSRGVREAIKATQGAIAGGGAVAAGAAGGAAG